MDLEAGIRGHEVEVLEVIALGIACGVAIVVAYVGGYFRGRSAEAREYLRKYDEIKRRYEADHQRMKKVLQEAGYETWN